MWLIKKYEGYYEKAYICPAGIPSIGFGTTLYPNGSSVKIGDTCTEEQAEEYLKYHCENRIKLPNVKLTNNQKDALYSLIYNIGQGAFDRSGLKTAIVKNDLKGIYKNWDWISGGGKALKGLCLRRLEELELFIKDFDK